MRRLFFVGAAPIGCVPLMRELSRLTTGNCHDGANDLSVRYNAAVRSLLADMSTQHPDFHYAFFDSYTALMQYINEPEANGMVQSALHQQMFCFSRFWRTFSRSLSESLT